MITLPPKNLEEAIQWVLTHVDKIESNPFETETEDQFVNKSHMSYGQWIRNNWGLWSLDSELSFWFLSLGIKHADDMSGIIITSAYRKYHNQDLKLEEQVQQYKDFWSRQDNPWKKEDNT